MPARSPWGSSVPKFPLPPVRSLSSIRVTCTSTKLWALLVRTRMGQFSLTPLLAVSLSYLYGLGHRHSSSELGKSLSCQR